MLRNNAVFSGFFEETEAKLIRKGTSVSFFVQKLHTNGSKEKRRNIYVLSNTTN